MRELVSYTDFLAICTARNERQARAIVDEVRVRLKQEHGLLPGGIDGAGAAGWIVLDYLDCVLHVFTAGGAGALPARGSLARGAAARARPRRARSALGRERLTRRTACATNAVRGPLRCRAWVASRGRSSATAAPKWTRRSRRGTRGSARSRREPPSASARRRRELRGRARLALGDGDRARARDPRPDRALARGQRAPRPQHRLAGRGLGPAGGDQAQARGQATRIRMKALREAVEVSRRAQELDRGSRDAAAETAPPTAAAANGDRGCDSRRLFEG